MFYLTRMLGRPVVDAAGETIGAISDVAIATREVFPRVTSLAFLGPEKTPFMLSWRKYVAEIDDERITLNVTRDALRFSYLQPDEILLHRDLLNQQIVDTQGMKVVRVNDLKLSESRNQLRLLGAEVGARGILRGLHPAVERLAEKAAKLFGTELAETLIAWNYMDLLDRDLSHVQLSVTHKRLHELHPADIADVLEQLSPAQRAKVFEHLDNTQAADTISELEDAFQADVIDDLGSQRASDILEIMDPDDAADVIGDLPYDKAEALLHLMGVEEAGAVRSLLGYREKTAGGIMTPEVTTVTEAMSVQQVIEHLRGEAAENESIYYIYVTDPDSHLEGVISLRDLVVSEPTALIADIVKKDVITADVEDDQEDVAEMMSKYDLLAMPVVDENGKLLGIVTVDDALEVLEEESAEDLELATGQRFGAGHVPRVFHWVSRDGWLLVWAAVWLALVWTIPRTPFWSKTQFELAVPLSIPAIIVLPFILRLVEDIAAHTLASIIEESDESIWLRLRRDVVSGLFLGAGAGVFSAMVFALANSVDVTSTLTLTYALPTAVAVLLTALSASALETWGRAMARRERRLPALAIHVALAVVAIALYIGLLELSFLLYTGTGLLG